MNSNNNWDTEEVLAFVHDVRPWRDMDQAERAEWVRRIKHIRDNVTTDDRPWTNERLAGMFGLTVKGLESRISRSEAISDPSAQQETSWADRKTRLTEEAAAKATAEAEAKAATELAAALARQEKAAEQARREAALKAKQEQERALKAQQETIRKEEQAKAKAAAERELVELRAKLAETAKAAQFDLSTLSEAQKAQVMTMLANDPEKAKEFFAAQSRERARKLQEEVNKQKEAEKRRKAQADERDAVKAAKAASKEYEESALCLFIESVIPSVDELNALLADKPVSFSHILRSGKTAQQLVELTEQMENLAVDMREAIFSANAEAQLLDIENS